MTPMIIDNIIFSMNAIIKKIYEYIKQNNMLVDCDEVILGLSGGADSVCLLNVLKKYIDDNHLSIRIKAIHVNHGIRESAAFDEDFSKQLCEGLGVEFIAYHIDAQAVAKDGAMSVEEAGRAERYRLFAEACSSSNSKIAVAHHMNDQAETVLMNLARGGMLRGLAGIKPVRDNIIRPLLCITRAEIESINAELKQNFVTDETNLSNDYTRNAIRNQILPVLSEKVNSAAIPNIARAANGLSDVYDYIREEADKAFRVYVEYVGDISGSSTNGGLLIRVDNDFNRLHRVIKSELVYRCIARLSGKQKDVYRAHVEAVLALELAEISSEANICYGVVAVRTYNGIELGLGHREHALDDMIIEVKPGVNLSYELNREIFIEGLGLVNAKAIEITFSKKDKNFHDYSTGLYEKMFDYDKINGKLQIRFKQPEDKIIISKTGGEKKLSRVFIDKKIPSHLRDCVLVVAENNSILWAVGVRRSEGALIEDATVNTMKITVRI